MKLLVENIKLTKKEQVTVPFEYDNPWISNKLKWLRQRGVQDPLQFLKNWAENGYPMKDRDVLEVVSCLYYFAENRVRPNNLRVFGYLKEKLDEIEGREDVLL